ncbi:MAG: amidohydrolase [Bacteroidaceae bacterium]|nr:amidohydrolase [Bacteroidaceae bacterium]
MMRLALIVVAILTLGLQEMSAQGIADKEILSKITQYDGFTREVRRHLHLYPEVGGHETETAKFLKAELAKIGNFEINDVPGSTGFYAILDTKRTGKTIGLRTDIDGLPIKESTVNGGGKPKPFLSKNMGVTQGCGHDGHMAVLLTSIRIIYDLRERLTGKYVFIFEEGEETNTGIRPMVAALKDIHFDVIYGNHLVSSVPSGQIYINEGSIMTGMAMLSWQVFGKGGHASRPDQAVNPIFAAANILTSVSIAWNNQRDITKLVTLGVTQFQGGETWNVIPDSVYVGGTLRFFDWDAGVRSLELIKKVATDVANAHGCQVRFGEKMTAQVPPVVNDPQVTAFARRMVDELYPGRATNDPKYNWYASETFALYNQLAPTLFTLVGVQNQELGTTAGHHTGEFDIDEDALQYAIGTMVKFAVSY